MAKERDGMLFSLYQKSVYHEKCAPQREPSKRSDLLGLADSPTGMSGLEKLNPEVYSRIQKEAILNEKRVQINWEKQWGFLKDYDEKGNYHPLSPLPDRTPLYSSLVPNTTSGVYGSRLESPVGKQIFIMQSKFNNNVGKRKMTSDLVCC